GEIRVRDGKLPLAAVCTSGEFYGEFWIEKRSEDPTRLELFPDRSVAIQVVDGAGLAMPGVQVGVVKRHTSGVSTLWTADTREPDGVATLIHLRARIPDALDDATCLVARIEAVLQEPVEEVFDPRFSRTTSVRLVLPETGRVVVSCLDAGGNPTRNSWVSLTPKLAKKVFEGRKPFQIQNLFATDGRVEF